MLSSSAALSSLLLVLNHVQVASFAVVSPSRATAGGSSFAAASTGFHFNSAYRHAGGDTRGHGFDVVSRRSSLGDRRGLCIMSASPGDDIPEDTNDKEVSMNMRLCQPLRAGGHGPEF